MQNSVIQIDGTNLWGKKQQMLGIFYLYGHVKVGQGE